MARDLVAETQEFVKRAFIANPHYSFNDWSVMYNHSVTVRDISLKIADRIPCDRALVSIGALLHDIGKTYNAPPEILHKEHEKFNLSVCGEFLRSLNLPAIQLSRLENIVSYQADCHEMDIIKDADALALYSDKKLYMLFIEWAYQNNLDAAILRKLDKFSRLRFAISREIGEPWYAQMKCDWETYIREHPR